MTATAPTTDFRGTHAIAESTPITDVLPADVAAVVLDLYPGATAIRAGTPKHRWKMWGVPMYWVRDGNGHTLGMCTRTVIWSYTIADEVGRRIDCPVQDSRYGRAARLSGRRAAKRGMDVPRRLGEIGRCGYEHAVNGVCPMDVCD